MKPISLHPDLAARALSMYENMVSAVYEQVYVDDVGAYLPDQWIIRCYATDCRTKFGSVHLAHRSGGGPVIGALVYIDPRMVERKRHPSKLPRFGVPDDVRRGGRPRRGIDPTKYRHASWGPFWAHCPKCNRGMLVAAMHDLVAK
jgi:hypothetical protein